MYPILQGIRQNVVYPNHKKDEQKTKGFEVDMPFHRTSLVN
jgi:hypothetical protein